MKGNHGDRNGQAIVEEDSGRIVGSIFPEVLSMGRDMEAHHQGRKIETKVVSGKWDNWIMEIQVWPVTLKDVALPRTIYHGLTCKLEEEAHAYAIEYAMEWIDDHP